MSNLLPPGISLSDIAAATDDLQLKEWCESLLAVIQTEGVDSAKDIMDALAKIMQHPHIGWKAGFNTPYINTIDVKRQPAYPGDLATEERLASIMRWNALTMVVRAN
ncbi:pyruvate dehydrogenase (acetyl-transferring), homodimeric type, partial [Pseudomonas fluorescens]|nr:pyruvate dehydrogenase (acetyl-transferring), homodimeric type [Pseudomonas fluorescens]